MIVDQLFNPKPLKEGGPYDLPGIDYDRPGDTPRKPRPSGSAIPRRHPDDPDFMDPDQRRLRADQERVRKANAEYFAKKKKPVNEAWLMEDPIYIKFKRVGRYIAERKLTEPEILKIFADAETGMTDKATGANRTFLGRGKDTTMDFAGGVADALKGVWSGIQSNVKVEAVDVAYDKATDALANVAGGQDGRVMQAIKKYRMLAKEYPKTAGLAKAALIAITGLATGGASLPAIGAFVVGLDSAIKGEKFSDIVLKAGSTAAFAWAANKVAGFFGGDQAAAGAEAGGMGDPSQLPPFDDAGNLSPGFHISPDDKMPYYTGDLAPTPTDIAAGYGPDGAAGLTGAEAAAGASRFDDIVKNAIDYKIKPDDTLSQILADKKINPEAFRRLPGNEVYFGPDGNPNIIKAGQTIKLPDPADIADLNRMSYTTPDSAGGNLQRFLDDPNFYTGQYNPNNSAYSLDATTNLKQQGMGRLGPDGGIAADRVAADAARQSGGPELLGGPGAGDVASAADVATAAAAPAPSPLTFDPATNSGTVTLPSGETIKASVFPQGGQFQPRLLPGGEYIKIPYGGQEVTGYVYRGQAYFTKFPAELVDAAGSSSAGASTAGTLSGVTSDQIMASPVYQQAYAQEIARYGAEPSARAIQTAQQIATMKAKAAMAGAVKESTNWINKVKLRRLPVDKLIDQKLTTLSWALNESVGKPQGRSMHLTPLGVYTVFENLQRIAELDKVPTDELSPEEIARNERIQKMYQATQGRGLERAADGRLVGFVPDPDDPEGPGPNAQLYYDDDFNLIGTSKPIPGLEISTPAPKPTPTPAPTPAPKPGPAPTPAPKPGPTPTPEPRDVKAGDPGVITVPNRKPTIPTPTPEPKLNFGSPEDTINRSRRNSATTVPLNPTPAPTPAPTPTTPTGDAAGPGREALPDLLRPDMSDAPTQPADPAKKSWFGRGLDALDRGTKAVGGALSTFGRQLTTNVTKEKLKMNWHQAGKPTDSDQLSAWLVKQGVPIGVVNGVYEKMGLPVSAEPVAATEPAATDAQARTGGAQKSMSFYGTNPVTQKPWTYDELQAKANAGKTPAADTPTDTTATDTTATNTTPAPTATKTTAGGPAGFNAGNVFKLPGMEKYAKSTPAKTPNFAGGPTGYGKTTMSVKPMTGVPGMKTTPAPAPTAAPAGTKVTSGGPTPDEKAKLDQRIAQALKQPVAEMLQMVETKEDVQKIKQFVDQTFTRYGAVSESAFAVRNKIIEHVTQAGAQRRREHSRKAAH